MVERYYRVPIIVHAIQFDNNSDDNVYEIMSFTKSNVRVGFDDKKVYIIVANLKVYRGDYIVKKPDGTFMIVDEKLFKRNFKLFIEGETKNGTSRNK